MPYVIQGTFKPRFLAGLATAIPKGAGSSGTVTAVHNPTTKEPAALKTFKMVSVLTVAWDLDPRSQS